METQTTTKPNGKYPLGPKYDTTTRIKVRRRIKELARNGLPYAKIAQVMSTEGFKTPAGAPVTKTLVSNQANAMGIKKHKLNKKTKGGGTFPREKTIKASELSQILLARKAQVDYPLSALDYILLSDIPDSVKVATALTIRGLKKT